MDDAAPYLRLMKLIENELELARNRKLRELRVAVEKTGEYMSTLPTPAPPAAQPTIQRAMGMRSRVAIEARRHRDEIQATRTALRRSRQLARSYAGGPQSNQYSTSA